MFLKTTVQKSLGVGVHIWLGGGGGSLLLPASSDPLHALIFYNALDLKRTVKIMILLCCYTLSGNHEQKLFALRIFSH
jgi:hypothetical protein